MSKCQKIKKGGLDQYDPECFGRLIFAIISKHVGLKGLMCAKNLTVMLSAVKIRCLSVDVHVACLNKSCSVNQSLGLCLVLVGRCLFCVPRVRLNTPQVSREACGNCWSRFLTSMMVFLTADQPC